MISRTDRIATVHPWFRAPAGSRSMALDSAAANRRSQEGCATQPVSGLVHKLARRALVVPTLSTILLTACSSTPAATQPPEPPATPVPTSVLVLTGFTYPRQVGLGDTFVVTVPVSNASPRATPVHMTFEGFGKADLAGCKPTCNVGHLIDSYAEWTLGADADASYQIQFVAKKLGVMAVTVCISDTVSASACTESGTISVVG